MYVLVRALFLVAQKHQENTFLKQCLYKYRSSAEQGPKEVAKPSWKEDFQSFIANLKFPWDSISCCSTVYICL